MIIKVIPRDLVFKNKENDFKIYKVDILNENNNDKIEEYGVSFIGEMIDLVLDVVYEADVEKDFNKNFGEQYKVNNVYKIDYSSMDEQILFSELFGKRLLHRILKQTEFPLTAILNKDIDINLLNINENELNNMVNKINSHKAYIEQISRFKDINISFKLAKKIIDEYGSRAIDVVKSNPYILYSTINGIGFKKADQIAIGLGISKDNNNRIINGIIYVLKDNLDKGNTWVYLNLLKKQVFDLLDIECYLDNYICEYNNLFYLNNDKVSLLKSFNIEKSIVMRLNAIKNSSLKKIYEKDDMLKKIGEYNEFGLTDNQIEFIKSLNNNNIVLLTGYAGTGKTYSINILLKVYHRFFHSVYLVSPTAKAAKVLSCNTGEKATTIHRLLGWSGKKFLYNESKKLSCDLIIIDEASMVDMYTFNSLLKAIDNKCKVIIVGDIAQLESVQCGNVFYDIVLSNAYKTIKYEEIHRQAKESGVIEFSYNIRTGNNLYFKDLFKDNSIFYKIKKDMNIIIVDKSEMSKKLLGIYKQCVNNGINDILVISPFKKQKLGSKFINFQLKNLINHKSGIDVNGQIISIGDKVKHTKNDYDRECFDVDDYYRIQETGVFNGDFGVVQDIVDNMLYVKYDDKIIKYEKPYQNIELAYAITCHSSQGSQADTTICIVDDSHYISLKRTLLYTMITRSKKNCILITTKKALYTAINNNTIVKKQTYINDIINGKFEGN